MTKSNNTPALWITAGAALALAAIAVFNPPKRGMVEDLPLPVQSAAAPQAL